MLNEVSLTMAAPMMLLRRRGQAGGRLVRCAHAIHDAVLLSAMTAFRHAVTLSAGRYSMGLGS